ncbi:hypothetical protein, partial [Acinetobacter baumannii]|uniref:hypothetical protein n=1 Tax=Acinetobacter baumannii TaxID=470 RepID=UPI001C089AB3
GLFPRHVAGMGRAATPAKHGAIGGGEPREPLRPMPRRAPARPSLRFPAVSAAMNVSDHEVVEAEFGNLEPEIFLVA